MMSPRSLFTAVLIFGFLKKKKIRCHEIVDLNLFFYFHYACDLKKKEKEKKESITLYYRSLKISTWIYKLININFTNQISKISFSFNLPPPIGH